MLAVGAGGVVRTFFSRLSFLFSVSLSGILSPCQGDLPL